MSAVTLTPGQTQRRSYDRLQLARVLARRWSLPAPEHTESAAWPYLALSSLHGRVIVRFGDREIELAQGEVCVLRNRSRIEVVGDDDVDLIVLRIPESSVGPHGQVLDAADGAVWSTRDGTASLVGHLFQGLAAQFEDYTPAHPGRLAEHIIGFVVLMCADGISLGVGGQSSLLLKAKEYIESHLGDIELSPDRIAAAQNVSTRTLHRLFEAQGLTISGWIRMRRLEHCRLDLLDRRVEAGSVSGIGTRWGLWDAAHFSRLFKSTYGLSPRAYRVQHSRHTCMDECLGSTSVQLAGEQLG